MGMIRKREDWEERLMRISVGEMVCRDVRVSKATVSSLYIVSHQLDEARLQATRDGDNHCPNGHDGSSATGNQDDQHSKRNG